MPRKRVTQSSPQCLPGVDDDLGVATGAEHVAQRLQFGAQLAEVVDLAVEHHDDVAVLVDHRLLAGGEVDDRQAAVAEADAGLDVQLALVGAAVVLGLVHARAAAAGRSSRVAASIENSDDSAHGVLASLS